MDKAIRVPGNLYITPYNTTALTLNGVSVIESCTFTEGMTGNMFLEDHMLMFVLEGVYQVRFGEEEHTVRKGQMVLLKKSILVQYKKYGEPGNENKLDYMLFFLKEELLRDWLKMAELPEATQGIPESISVENVTPRLQGYLESLRPYFGETGHIDRGLLRIKLLELLFDLANANPKLMRQMLQLKQPLRANIPETIEANVLNPVSLADLAYLSGRSLSSFKRDFQAIYNMPPSQWIRERRLERARDLLSTTAMSVTEVCYATGFEAIGHFSRLYKEHFGHSPSTLRRKEVV
jgi:AraC-like DNA-binding protein